MEGKKNLINLVYEKKSNWHRKIDNNIFGEKFVENNKNNIELKINGKNIGRLTSKFKLEKGINNIQILIINKITNLEHMFDNCANLINIEDLKYLEVKDVNNFSFMFNGCSSLSDIKYH